MDIFEREKKYIDEKTALLIGIVLILGFFWWLAYGLQKELIVIVTSGIALLLFIRVVAIAIWKWYLGRF